MYQEPFVYKAGALQELCSRIANAAAQCLRNAVTPTLETLGVFFEEAWVLQELERGDFRGAATAVRYGAFKEVNQRMNLLWPHVERREE